MTLTIKQDNPVVAAFILQVGKKSGIAETSNITTTIQTTFNNSGMAPAMNME